MRRTIIVGAVAAGLIAAGAGIAFATGSQDDDGAGRPITGPALENAKKAALDRTGGGRVTETETGDEEGYYEVEVTMPDGRQVDVHLDKTFTVLNAAGDTGEGDAGGTDGG
jgi:hypothetical protein